MSFGIHMKLSPGEESRGAMVRYMTVPPHRKMPNPFPEWFFHQQRTFCKSISSPTFGTFRLWNFCQLNWYDIICSLFCFPWWLQRWLSLFIFIGPMDFSSEIPITVSCSFFYWVIFSSWSADIFCIFFVVFGYMYFKYLFPICNLSVFCISDVFGGIEI